MLVVVSKKLCFAPLQSNPTVRKSPFMVIMAVKSSKVKN